VLTLLYVPYMLILRKESFFRLNRAVLLLILLFSVVLPVVDVHFLSLDSHPVVQATKDQMIQVGIPVHGYHLLPELDVQARHVPTQIAWFRIVSVLFSLVALAILLWRTVQVLRMNHEVTCGSLWHEVEGGVHIHCRGGEVSPFSWMNHVVISEKDFHENGREILLHETGHIRALHSWDLLLLSAVQILQWWNPLAYVLGMSLRDVHEYEADDNVLRHGVSAREYQLLLIKKAVGASSYTFANNFNHNLTLKRIIMMQKSKSSVWMRSKVLYIIPMAGLALSAFATSEPASPSSGSIAIDEDKVIKISSSVQEGHGISAVPMQTDGKDVVYLLDGKEASGDVIRNLPTLDIASMTVIKNGDASKSLGYAGKTVIVIETKTKLDTLKVNIVENPAWNAQFKGGETAMMQWLSRNTRYPKVSQSAGVQARVKVQFYVSETGRIFNVRAVSVGRQKPEDGQTLEELIVQSYAKEMAAQGKTLSAEESQAYKAAMMALLKEAERVVREMPEWEPGYLDKEKTKPCTVKFVLPIMFRLG
jgi:hypothetical protein